GMALRKRGNDEASLPVFQRAYDLSHSARAAAQLGFAEQALGLWPDAERHVSEALRADRDPWIARNRAVIGLALETIRRNAALSPVPVTGGVPPPASV